MNIRAGLDIGDSSKNKLLNLLLSLTLAVAYSYSCKNSVNDSSTETNNNKLYDDFSIKNTEKKLAVDEFDYEIVNNNCIHINLTFKNNEADTKLLIFARENDYDNLFSFSADNKKLCRRDITCILKDKVDIKDKHYQLYKQKYITLKPKEKHKFTTEKCEISQCNSLSLNVLISSGETRVINHHVDEYKIIFQKVIEILN